MTKRVAAISVGILLGIASGCVIASRESDGVVYTIGIDAKGEPVQQLQTEWLYRDASLKDRACAIWAGARVEIVERSGEKVRITCARVYVPDQAYVRWETMKDSSVTGWIDGKRLVRVSGSDLKARSTAASAVGESLCELSGVLHEGEKTIKPFLALDGSGERGYVQGDALAVHASGTRLLVKGLLRSELYDATGTDRTKAGAPSPPPFLKGWLVYLDVKEAKAITEPFAR